MRGRGEVLVSTTTTVEGCPVPSGRGRILACRSRASTTAALAGLTMAIIACPSTASASPTIAVGREVTKDGHGPEKAVATSPKGRPPVLGQGRHESREVQRAPSKTSLAVSEAKLGHFGLSISLATYAIAFITQASPSTRVYVGLEALWSRGRG